MLCWLLNPKGLVIVKVVLYGTVGCHLCELAKQLLWPLVIQYQYRLTEIDIAGDDNLLSRYGVRIPVLGSPAIARELNWPFSVRDAELFFAELSDI